MATPKAGYRTADGNRVPSVTTIIGRFKDSGALIKWAYTQGREHELGVHQGKPDPGSLYAVTEKAALAGTIAHDMIEHDILTGDRSGTWVPATAEGASEDVMKRALNSYRQFQQWRDNSRITVTQTERGYVSEKHRFGGTLDGLGTDAFGRLILIDWKTSNRVYADYLLQLAAYALLVEEIDGTPIVGGFHLLRVAKESGDFAHHYFAELEEAKQAFLLQRQLYDAMARVEKRL